MKAEEYQVTHEAEGTDWRRVAVGRIFFSSDVSLRRWISPLGCQ